MQILLPVDLCMTCVRRSQIYELVYLLLPNCRICQEHNQQKQHSIYHPKRVRTTTLYVKTVLVVLGLELTKFRN